MSVQVHRVGARGCISSVWTWRHCGRRKLCGDVSTQPRFVSSTQAPYAHPFYWAPFILIGNWK